ncbi:hypothetical protein K450DRAFT_217983 [Umbelopsis ramanniana AG]|uniref:Uncharacterized protein n=1 Tax=Umbelopsis ramanniana AG TaxID=1314678 RepID=A0AAD5EK17_UMBRA|nr:uncharacterized protein K450DRAFT_217983 [Umbelopsis ramanniana AG]KAI8584779.1 hypothetical protein K450DRAFT_217983 [Umbelopsis ramanniana AG]
MSMYYANAFWAAQESSFDNGDLFLPADTPTGTMTLAMVNKRKNTLVNRHKQQLQRLCDLQSNELQENRRDFCSLHKDRISQMYTHVHPRSEVGMFEEISGSEWLQDNQHNIFQSATEEEASSEDAENERGVNNDQLVAFDELVEQLNKEQNEMRIKQMSEYENYRLFQMRELQMLNFDITTHNSARSQSTSTPDALKTSSIEQSAIPAAASNDGLRRSPVKPALPESRPDSNQFQATRIPPHPTSHSATPPPRSSSNYVHSDRRTVRPPSRSNERTDSRDRKTQRQSQNKHSHDQFHSRRTSSRSDREDSPREYHRISRKHDRPRSSSDNSDREADRKRRNVRSDRLKSRRSPPRSSAPSPRPRMNSKPIPVKIELPQARNDNLPPTVMASSTSNKGKTVAASSKSQPHSSVVVEIHDGTPEVVRRYMGGKQPKEYLGRPVDFDDALYDARKPGNIRQVHAYWEGESSLCFMNQRTHTILGRVNDIEPVIRKHLVHNSRNSDM